MSSQGTAGDQFVVRHAFMAGCKPVEKFVGMFEVAPGSSTSVSHGEADPVESIRRSRILETSMAPEGSRRRWVWGQLGCLLLALALLAYEYPWSIYQGSFHFPWQVTAISYLITALMTVLMGATVPSMLLRRLRSPDRLADPVTFGITSFAGLIVLTLVFAGLGLGLDIPGARIRRVFFWQLSNYLGDVGLPFSILASRPWWWSHRGLGARP